MIGKMTIGLLLVGLIIGSSLTCVFLFSTFTPQLDATRSDVARLRVQLTESENRFANQLANLSTILSGFKTDIDASNLYANLSNALAGLEKTKTDFLSEIGDLATKAENLSATLMITREELQKIQGENLQLSKDLNALREDYLRLAAQSGSDASKVFEMAKPGVVSVSVYDQSDTLVAIGSGFVYSRDGYVVTNNHVTETGVSYLLTFLDGSEVRASLKGNDPLGDVSVLYAQLPAYAKPLELADSNILKIGEPVFAMGSPIGLVGSISSGIVSQLNRTIPDYSFLFYIQTDTPINPGNSGGPLLNSEGGVIGINTFGYEKNITEGLGFAIPSNIIGRVVPRLIESGTYTYPLLGIRGIFLDLIQNEALNLPPSTSGWLIQEIIPDSGAAQSNLRNRDIIVAINDYEVHHEHDISYIMNQFFSPGDRVVVKVLRNSQTLTVDLILGSR